MRYPGCLIKILYYFDLYYVYKLIKKVRSVHFLYVEVQYTLTALVCCSVCANAPPSSAAAVSDAIYAATGGTTD